MVKHCYSTPLIAYKVALGWLKCWILACLFISPVFSQHSPEKDSLLQLLQTLPNDVQKVHVLNKLCYLCRTNDSKNALKYGQRALILAQKLGFLDGQGFAHHWQGLIYRDLGDYDKAVKFQKEARGIWSKLKDSINLAKVAREIGVVYRRKGEFAKALDYLLNSLKLLEDLKDKRGESNVAASIGVLYNKQHNYDKALVFHNRALALHQELGAKPSISIDFNNLGNVYVDKKDYDHALYFYNKSQKIKEELQDSLGIATTLGNIGYVYSARGDAKRALTFYEQSLNIYNSKGAKRYQTFVLQYIAEAYRALDEYDKAIVSAKKGLGIAQKIGAKYRVMEITLALSEIYEDAQKYKNALFHFQKYKKYRDSIFNEKKSKQIADMATKYETEKKEQKILFFKKEDEKNKALIHQRNNLIAAITLGALLLILLAMVLYQSNQRKQRTNQVLLFQKQEIEVKTEEILAQRDMLEQQHKDIRDSINYARKIQTAILPLPEEISAAIPEHFIFYQPRDIVSGDFYWFASVKNEQTGKEKYIISASDCTGHGVPGAFMSMIGNDLLNDLVKARQITQPDIILNKLHKGVRRALHQESSENTDGMDISLCVIDPIEKTIEYAGANSALVYVKEGERTRIAPDKTSIGGDMHASQEGFTAHTISYADAPVMCYLYTDGYRDQFGGERGKKFLRSRMQELIFYISGLSMQEQRRQVENTINDWMQAGGFEQMDDMLVIGFNLS